MIRRRLTVFVAALAIMLVVPSSDALAHKPGDSGPVVTVLNSTALGGLGSGSTIGPDGALYVTNGNAGTLVRIDPRNGSETVVGSGLPLAGRRVRWRDRRRLRRSPGVRARHRRRVRLSASPMRSWASTASSATARSPSSPTWAHGPQRTRPRTPTGSLAQGLQYSLDVWHNGFLVADAHLGRLIRVDLRGQISELVAFDSTDSVPTGLEVANGKVFVATAGPTPHLPADSAINASATRRIDEGGRHVGRRLRGQSRPHRRC